MIEKRNFLLFFIFGTLITGQPNPLYANNTNSLFSNLLFVSGTAGCINELMRASKKTTREQKKYKRAKRQGRRFQKPTSFIWHMRPLQTLIYISSIITGLCLHRESPINQVTQRPTLPPNTTPTTRQQQRQSTTPTPHIPQNTPEPTILPLPDNENDDDNVAVALSLNSSLNASLFDFTDSTQDSDDDLDAALHMSLQDKHPKTCPIQYKDALSFAAMNALQIPLESHAYLQAFTRLIPGWDIQNKIDKDELLNIFSDFSASLLFDAQGSQNSQQIFLQNKENMLPADPQLTNDIAIQLYRQYWNTNPQELSTFFTELVTKIAQEQYPKLHATIDQFIPFLNNPDNFKDEPIASQYFYDCADQSLGEDTTANCGPYALKTALILAASLSDEEEQAALKARDVYENFNQEIRKLLVIETKQEIEKKQNSMNDPSTPLNFFETDEEREEKKEGLRLAEEELRKKLFEVSEGNLTDLELQKSIPKEYQQTIFIEDFGLFLNPIDDEKNHLACFEEAAKTYNANKKVIFIVNQQAHWICVECCKNDQDKMIVRAFDSTTCRELNRQFKNNATNSTAPATIIAYAFANFLKEKHQLS